MTRKKLTIPATDYPVKGKTIHRKGWTDRFGHYHPPSDYHREAQTIHRKSYKKQDLGAPGRGPKLIEIKGTMKIGGREYHTSLPEAERHSILRALIERYGIAKVWRRLHAMVNMRKREQPEQRKIFEKDRDWVAETFGTKSLTPRAAVKKWKEMSHVERVKARA